jgi:hypothetical protein
MMSTNARSAIGLRGIDMSASERHWPVAAEVPNVPGPVGAYHYKQAGIPLQETRVWRPPSVRMQLRLRRRTGK